MYGIICRHFKENEKLARPLAMQEIQQVVPRPGRNQLRNFLGKWDASAEKLVNLMGDNEEPDKDALYLAFKKHFMTMPELAEQGTRVKRSLPHSIHSHAWMYSTAKAVVETQRLEGQEDERDVAQEPDARDPLTPAPVVKTPKREHCQRSLPEDGIDREV